MSSYVFNSYLYDISMQGKDYYEPTFFDVWLCQKGISVNNDNVLSATLGSLSEKFNPSYMTYLGNLGDMEVRLSDESGMPTNDSYQKIFEIPVSGYLFSNEDCPQDIPFRKDFSFITFDYGVYDKMQESGFSGDFVPTESASAPLWADARKPYFEAEYGFSSGYSKAEYIANGVSEERLLDKYVSVNTDNVSLSSDVHSCLAGALLISRYTGKRIKNIDKQSQEWASYSAYSASPSMPLPEFSGMSVPCIYYELQKTYKLKNAVVNIRWSENGLFRFS